MNNILRIIVLVLLTVVCGISIGGIIYAPRFFKVAAIIILVLSVLIVYNLVKQWLNEGKTNKDNGFTEAEIIEDENN